MSKRYSLKRKFHKIPKYNAGTLVRVSRPPEAFRKGYESGWTLEIFRIALISCARQPPVYTLEDLNGEVIDGINYEEELCPIKKTLLKLFSKLIKFCKLKVAERQRSISLAGVDIRQSLIPGFLLPNWFIFK